MTKNHRLLTATIGCSLLIAVAIAEARPGVTISKHPRLVAAQKSIGTAWDKIEEARLAYKDLGVTTPFGGHVNKAKQLLEEANAELQAAANYADSKK